MEWAHRLCELPNQGWKRPRVEEELYNLESDPNEQVNLAGEARYRQKLKEMRDMLRRHMESTADPFLDKGFTRDYNAADYTRTVPGGKYK